MRRDTFSTRVVSMLLEYWYSSSLTPPPPMDKMRAMLIRQDSKGNCALVDHYDCNACVNDCDNGAGEEFLSELCPI